MMKNGQLNLVFAAAFAAILTGCPGPVMPPSGDSGMPDNDAYVLPPVDGGMDIDAYVEPGTDAGTDAASLPGACTPDQIAAGSPGCTSCYCEMDSVMAEGCAMAPEQCRTGVGMRNTCDMTGNNRCGFALPLDGSGNMTTYTGGLSSACQLLFDHMVWNLEDGTQFNVDLMSLNGQYVMRWSSVMGSQFSCEQVDGHDVCYNNGANADLDLEHVVLTPTDDCMSARFQSWHGTLPYRDFMVYFNTRQL